MNRQMVNELPRPEDVNYEYCQMELLEALLEPEDALYPWDTTAPEAEAYFADREKEFVLEDWSDEEMAARSQTFFTQIEQLWSASNSLSDTTNAAVTAIQANLQQRFAAHIPQGWLDRIAHHAHQVFSSQSSMADQLVQCVQDLLPNWAEEDLLVLARPFAYAMRSPETEVTEFVLGNVNSRDWAALSEIEQARTGLALARYALGQFQSSQTQNSE